MSEPRKSRREPKLSQRFKEFLEESTPVKASPKATKTPAKAEPKTPQNKKTVVAKTPTVKKTIAAVKTPAEKQAPKTPLNKNKKKQKVEEEIEEDEIDEEEEEEEQSESDEEPPPATRRSAVKETKKPVGKGKKPVEVKETEKQVLINKRVSKPSNKITEAKEADESLDSSEEEKPSTSKVATPAGRGRGSKRGGVVGRGRGRGRGRGGGGGSSSMPQEVEKTDEDTEDDKTEDEAEPIKQVKKSPAARGRKVSIPIGSPNNIAKSSSTTFFAAAKSSKIATGSKTPLKTSSNTTPSTVKVTNTPAKSSLKIATTTKAATVKTVSMPTIKTLTSPAKKTTEDSPVKSVKSPVIGTSVQSVGKKVVIQTKAVGAEPADGKGLKRVLVKQPEEVSESSSAKKIKIVAGKTPTSPQADSLKPVSAVSTNPIKLSKVTAKGVAGNQLNTTTTPGSSNKLAANGGPTKQTITKLAIKTVSAAPKTPAIRNTKLNSTPSVASPVSSGGEGGETRRSRRQPKITERMKEFLHMDADGEEVASTPSVLKKSMKSSAKLDELDEEELEDEDLDTEEEDMEFLNVLKNNATKTTKVASSPLKKVSVAQKTGSVSKSPMKNILPIKTTQVAGKLPSNLQLKGVNRRVVQVKPGQPLPPGATRVSIKRPLSSVNGESDNKNKGLMMLPPASSKITTKRVAISKSSEPPIIIKVRTLTSEDVDKKKKKEDELDAKHKNRKIIKVNTLNSTLERRFAARNVVRKKPPSGAALASEESEEDDSMEDDMDTEGEEEMEDEMEEMGLGMMNQRKLNSVNKSSQKFNTKMLELCGSSIRLLAKRKYEFQANKLSLPIKHLTLKVINKFTGLATEITNSICTAIKEEGDSLSDSTTFHEYCQDVMDSISLNREDNNDLSAQEADNLLNLIRQIPLTSVKMNDKGSDDVMFLTHILDMMSMEEKFDSSMDEDELFGDADEEEDEGEEIGPGFLSRLNLSANEEELEEEELEDEEGGEEEEEEEVDEEEIAPPPKKQKLTTVSVKKGLNKQQPPPVTVKTVKKTAVNENAKKSNR